MPIEEGEKAPEIEAYNQDNQEVTLDHSDPTVIFFYPEDGTPGCTTEAEQFQKELETYREAGVKVFGISTDEIDSHRQFADALGLEFDLLSDSDGEIARNFSVEVDDGSAERTTFVVVDGKIHDVYCSVSPDGHAREVLKNLLDKEIVTLDD